MIIFIFQLKVIKVDFIKYKKWFNSLPNDAKYELSIIEALRNVTSSSTTFSSGHFGYRY